MFKFLSAASVILILFVSAATVKADDRYQSRGYHHGDDQYSDSETHHREYRRYRPIEDWRESYYENNYEDYLGPLSRDRLILEINSQGFYWVYNIRPSYRKNYITALAFDGRYGRYGGRSVYLRVNQYTGHIFYIRYN